MKKILIIGYYGTNIGDLLMLKSLVSIFQKINIDVEVLTYATPNLVDLKEVGLNNIKINDISHGSFVNKLKLFYYAIKESNAIAWGGGTCFGEFAGNGGLKFMILSKLMGKKVYYLNIGIGKIKSTKNKIETVISLLLSNGVILRDKNSFQQALNIYPYNKNNYKLSHDLLYLYEISNKISNKNEKPYILVAYRDLESFDNFKQNKYIIDTVSYVKKLMKEYNIDKLILVDTDNIVDSKSSSILFEKFKELNLNIEYNRCNLSEKISLIANASIIITGRLHVAFLANLYKVPFKLFNYSPKNYNFLKEINGLSNLIEYDDLLTTTNIIVQNYFKTSILVEYRKNIENNIKNLLSE